MSWQHDIGRASARLVRLAEAAEFRKSYQVRHKCLLSYHADDLPEVEDFLENFGDAFIPRVIGISEDDPLVGSDDTDYVMDQIREKYLVDSTVTIVMIGSCTWARRFVDWEVYSTLRNDKNNHRSGLMAVQLPSVDGTTPSIPGRLSDNLPQDGGAAYARYYRHPGSEATLRTWIQDAFDWTTRSGLIVNTRARKAYNSSCP